jgi:hypothetical protein
MTRWASPRARAWARAAIVGAALTAGARAASGQGGGVAAISNGIGLLARRDPAGAAREFRRAAQDSSAAVRAAGEQWLAHLSWMVYADASAAADHLGRATIEARDSSMILVERARFLGFQRRYRAATETAVAAMRSSVDRERRGLAARTAMNAAVEGSFAAIAANTSIVDSIEQPIIRETLDTLRERVIQFPGRTADALAMLEAGTLLGDRAAIIDASASYFLLMHGSPRSMSSPATDAFVSLAMGLADNRLYEPAALLLDSERRRTGDKLPARAEDAAAYGVFVHQLRAATNEFYRRALLGLAREGDLDRVLNSRTRSLWPTLHWPGHAPQYYPAAVPAELSKRFGTVMSIERGVPMPELHLAHVIETYSAVTATDPSPKGRIVVLDEIASNGVEFWLLDGAGGRAGWVSGDSIFEVRPTFTETPFRAWMAVADPRAFPGELFQHDDAADVARARADSAAYLPGMAARLFHAGASVILDSLAHETMSGAQRQAAFVGILFNQLTETTIALHESRHLADARRKNRRLSETDAEFRAKIDEVAFASRPKLAMTAIIHPNIGDETPHGQANRRIMLGLVRWIRGHSSEIAGFDASIPPLVQLPLLSDAQLRVAFQSMRGSS